MNRIKRWTTALICQMDQALAAVENHEALADSLIRDVRRATAQAKVRLDRVRADGERLRRSLAEHREAEARWRERARECADSDEERAIDCLRRSRAAARAVPEVERRLALHESTERQLDADVARVEARLEQLVHKRNLMRTRQSSAQAASSAHTADSLGDGELDRVFDRWETQITELELEGGTDADVDPLQLEYSEAEERQQLLAELAELRNGGE